MTCFIAILTLLRWSGSEPAISSRYACTSAGTLSKREVQNLQGAGLQAPVGASLVSSLPEEWPICLCLKPTVTPIFYQLISFYLSYSCSHLLLTTRRP